MWCSRSGPAARQRWSVSPISLLLLGIGPSQTVARARLSNPRGPEWRFGVINSLAARDHGVRRHFMLHLTTLGVARSTPDRLQPKRLALLAYLAIARPRGAHRRDALVAIFWPELDQHGARS